MARRRRKRSITSLEIRPEVYAVLLIILAVLSYGNGAPLGIVGKMARCFAVFLFGSLDWLFILSMLLIGIYTLLKGKSPSFWSTKFIGLLMVAMGILVFAHMGYLTDVPGGAAKIYDVTFNDVMETSDLIINGTKFVSPGGGIVGCTFAVGFRKLFSLTGAKIVAGIFIAVGTCLFTGFSISEFFSKATEKGKDIIKKNKEARQEKKNNHVETNAEGKKDSVVIINDNNAPKEPTEDEQKLVISSIDELKKMNAEVKEENELPKQETIENLLTDEYIEKPKPKKVNNFLTTLYL